MITPILNLTESRVIRDERYGTVFELAGEATGLPYLGFALVEVDPGATSPAHFHTHTSELYYIIGGRGCMVMNDVETDVGVGDCISISPNTIHSIRNNGDDPLKFLCATNPAYDPSDDTEV
jgi:mannose-6-phosphate isomerase-like protein (cupin superfamily)